MKVTIKSEKYFNIIKIIRQMTELLHKCWFYYCKNGIKKQKAEENTKKSLQNEKTT